MGKLLIVTEIEKETLFKLIERKNSLIELNKIICDKELKHQLISDIEKSQESIHNWWSDVKYKYRLKDKEDSCYYFDFMDGYLYIN